MTSGRSLSMILPAYNEGASIERALRTTVEVCSVLDFPYEIIVVNDCSTDDTLEKAEKVAQSDSRVRLVSNPKNLGFGGAFRRGLTEARYRYALMLCADDDLEPFSLKDILTNVGRADVVITYTQNTQVRPLTRRIISRAYTSLINRLFGLRLRYFNGHNIVPTRAVQEMRFGDGFSFSAEMIVRLLKGGYGYCEIPMVIKERGGGISSAFRPRNIAVVCGAIVRLWLEVHLFSAHIEPAENPGGHP